MADPAGLAVRHGERCEAVLSDTVERQNPKLLLLRLTESLGLVDREAPDAGSAQAG